MFKVEFFDNYGDYEVKVFDCKKKYINFLDWCTDNDIQVLDHDDTYED